MSENGRIMTFLLIVLSVWTLMHAYVVLRLWNLPAAPSSRWHLLLAAAGVLLWISFPLSQYLSRSVGQAAASFGFIASTWVGVLFLLLVCLLAADLVTGFGWLFPAWSRPARATAVGAAAVLSVIALVQGLRAPEVLAHDVEVRGLRREYDGLRIVQLSDLHVGPFLRERWLDARIAQVQALRPDIVVITGDLVDHDASLAEPLVPRLQRLRAPLGVWGVLGNHEFYAGLPGAVEVFERSGIRLLRDASVELAPGLVMAGVDDLSARRQFGVNGRPVDRALTHRPPGSTIFLCHSPWEVERAAQLGVDLMLSGHTHSGQIWPFTYLVRIMYPYVVGRFGVNGMTLIVSRGTGFWGPPMRLFRPGEITAITLRSR
jgi:predicted MPP superfamily phosphohydrolase